MLEKRMMRTFLIALLAWVGALAPALAEGEESDVDTHAATLTAINPPREINGLAIEHVVVSIDRRPLGDCWHEHVKQRPTCGKPRQMAEGNSQSQRRASRSVER